MKFLGLISIFLLSCSHIEKTTDNYLWLEEVEGKEALTWVKEQNQKSKTNLEKDPRFQTIYKEAKQILGANDRLSYVRIYDKQAYHFYQSGTHVKGILRRTSLASYLQGKPKWETVLDVDQLAKTENENWAWKGSVCYPPAFQKCLFYLSRGGKDAKVAREYDLVSKTFVKNGFYLPESKGEVSWINENQLLIATDFGPDSMTSSGYPRQVRLWNRGEDYKNAKLLLEVNKEAVSASGASHYSPTRPLIILEKHPSFFESEFFILNSEQKLVQIQIPKDALFWGLSHGQVLFENKSEWRGMKAGTLFSVNQQDLEKTGSIDSFHILFQRNDTQSLLDVNTGTDVTYISYLENVRGRMARLEFSNKKWQSQEVVVPKSGMAQIFSTDFKGEVALIDSTDYLEPSQIWSYKIGGKPQLVYSLPKRFQSDNLISEQKFAISKDGTRIPYTIMRHKQQTKGPYPTILYGYGGFENSLTPNYMSVKGKTWLERGGIYVIANTRGGGEFGPEWHQAVLKQNRQKVFDDFIAVAEDLIRTQVTNNDKLAIEGYSNGGLLVGAVMAQRPDLFKAVICGVPLLDMLRYHKLLAGASWIGEYGDPDIASDQKYIAAYSPYQKVKAGVKYPNVFLLTSTKDDRVHPGHARKMAAKLQSFGAPVTYYENIDGGHAAAVDIEWRAKLEAYRTVFLLNTLF